MWHFHEICGIWLNGGCGGDGKREREVRVRRKNERGGGGIQFEKRFDARLQL